MGGFLPTSAKPMLQLLCALCFHHHQLDFATVASQTIIMQTCEEFRVEWESVVLFGVVVVVVVVVLCGVVVCVVLWCGVVVCVCMLRNKFLSRVRTQPVLLLFVHPCKHGRRRIGSIPIRRTVTTTHTHNTDAHNKHTDTTKHRHNKAQLHHAGLFLDAVVSFMTPSAPLEKSK